MLKFKIVTPTGITYADDTVEEVIIPTTTGQISVLTNHIPLVSILAPGELIVKKAGQEIIMSVSGGLVEIRPGNELYIIADSAERAEHIDLSRAEEARKRAEELMKQEQSVDGVEFAKLQAKMEKELARLRVGRKYRKLPNINQ